jgi:uncharacterized protein
MDLTQVARPLLVVAVIVAGAAALLWLNSRTGVMERPLIYFPQRAIGATPAAVGLEYEELTLEASDGVLLQAWFVPGDPARGRKITWLWFHGNGGNIGHRVDQLRMLHDQTGVSVLILSYRGYGRSHGRPDEPGFYLDARAALGYLRSRPDVEVDRIVYFGRSIGAAVAAELAVAEPPLGLILETPFPSVPYVARQVYPWLPVGRFLRTQFDTLAIAPDVTVPTLVIQGDEDEIVPVDGARRVAEALGGEVEWHLVPGARHNDVPWVGGEAYYARLNAFLDGLLSRLQPADGR